MMETVHLLRSPANATRLFDAIARAEAGEGQHTTLNELTQELGFGEEEG